MLLQVVLNKGLRKTQKVRFFSPAVLANIASLYKWKGIVDATADDDAVGSRSFPPTAFTSQLCGSVLRLCTFFCQMVTDSEQAGLSVVRELVHSFLLDLCCSRKHGISFHDASLGTVGK